MYFALFVVAFHIICSLTMNHKT